MAAWIAAVMVFGWVVDRPVPGSLGLSPEETNLRPCPQVVELTVEEVPTAAHAECDLVDSTVEFPDGRIVEIGRIGTLREDSDHETRTSYYVANLGTNGIAVALSTKDGTRWWGSPTAIELEKNSGANFGPSS